MEISRTGIVVSILTLVVGVGVGIAIPIGQPSDPGIANLREQIISLQSQLAERGSQRGLAQSLLAVNAEIRIPLQKGLFNGQEVFYISTEASDDNTAREISQATGFPVTFAPAIGELPESALANFFVFTNGIRGDGIRGFQEEVFDSIPGDPIYSPAWIVNNVEWINEAQSRELLSVAEIVEARQQALIRVVPTDTVVNCPFVMWPGGQLPLFQGVHDDSSAYGQAQVLRIDTAAMEVVFRAHRGWAQDGSQIAYIVTDASIAMPASDMGVVHASRTQNALNTRGSSELWQFTNGIPGSGPMGFQAGIAASKPGDTDYSPFWAIRAITWSDPGRAAILESRFDINLAEERGLIRQEAMMGGMIVNCPFVPIGLLS